MNMREEIAFILDTTVDLAPGYDRETLIDRLVALSVVRATPGRWAKVARRPRAR